MSEFSDVCMMLIACQVQTQGVSELEILKLVYYQKLIADDLISSAVDGRQFLEPVCWDVD